MEITVNIDPKHVSGFQTVVKSLTNIWLKINIINVEIVNLDNGLFRFIPITEDNVGLFENSLNLSRFVNIFNGLEGYEVLSDDLLAPWVIQILYEQGEFRPDDLTFDQRSDYKKNIIYVYDIALIPIGNEDLSYLINETIRNKRKDGYFRYEISINNIKDYYLVKELSSLWSIEVVSDNPTNLVLKTTSDLGTTPIEWIRTNLEYIKLGSFPTITLYGDWQQYKVGGDYNQIYGKIHYDALLNYLGLLVYKGVIDHDPFLSPFISQLRINPDLSITISVPTYNHSIMFKTKINEILNQDELIYNETCDGLEDGLAKRQYVYNNLDDKSYPMILPHRWMEDGEIKHSEILIFRSPLVKSGIDIPNLEPISMDANDLAIRGIYSLAELPGLVNPTRLNSISPKVGTPKISSDGSVKVKFSNGVEHPWIINRSDLGKTEIDNLWKSGELLSYWDQALQLYSDPESFLPIPNKSK